MEIRIIATPQEHEALEALTQELRRLLDVYYERDLSRREGPGTRRYIKARVNKGSSRSSQED